MKYHLKQKPNSEEVVVGIDLGSRNIKIAILKSTISRNTITFQIFDTVDFYKNYIMPGEEGFFINWGSLGLPSDVNAVATGYGRETAAMVGARIYSEISAHTIGAVWQTGLKDFTLIDMGGQDSKVIDVKGGIVSDFKTNDRCAASTGRYLENMARILGMDINQISQFYQAPADLTSVCAVFGETELLTKIATGTPVIKLASGVNHALVRRFESMITGGKREHIVLTGGVAKSPAIRKILREKTSKEPVVPRFPQYNGALGCLKMTKLGNPLEFNSIRFVEELDFDDV